MSVLLLLAACIPPTPDKKAQRDDTVETGDSGGSEECEGGGTPSTWYRDADADGHGDPGSSVDACDAPPDYVASADDCDDRDDTAFPGSHAVEIAGDGIDTDCDGADVCHDLNCDGWPDLVFGSALGTDDAGAALSWIYRGGADLFSDEVRVPLTTSHALGVSAGDVNGDGYLDLAFGSVPGAEGEVTAASVFAGVEYAPDDEWALGTVSAAGTAVADLDGDGKAEVIVANPGDATSRAADSAIFAVVDSVWTEIDALPTTGAAACIAGDVDGDGLPDLVFADATDGTTYAVDSVIYRGTSAGYSTASTLSLPTLGAAGVAIADVDGDGTADVLFANERDDDGFAVDSYIYLGGHAFSAETRIELQTDGARDVAVGDLDADGFPDVVFADAGDGATAGVPSLIYWGSASGFGEATEIAAGSASAVDIADLDLDGDLDIVFARGRSSSDVTPSYVYWGNGTRAIATSSPTELATVGAAAVMACPGGKRCAP